MIRIIIVIVTILSIFLIIAQIWKYLISDKKKSIDNEPKKRFANIKKENIEDAEFEDVK